MRKLLAATCGLLFCAAAVGQTVIPGSVGTATTTATGVSVKVWPLTCTGTDKLKGVDASGHITCGADLSGGAGTLASTGLIDFSATAASSSGQLPIWDSTAPNSAGGVGAYVPGDPLVQGLVAEGVATPNPVVIGGKTGGGLNKAIAVDASGFITANINGGVAVTGTFFQATQPVSIASMPSTPVTGTFWQATQPVSGTFWQATQPVSLASVPSHAVTNAGTFSVQVTSAPTTAVTGTFWQATQPVSGTVSITANSAVNTAQINGITPLMGNGITGTGSQRVTIASDNTAFPVNATLQTGGNVIGHVICDSGCTPGGSFADNAAFTFGTTAVNLMGAVVDDVATNAATENSAAAPRMSTNRVLFVDLKNTQANTTALLVTGAAGTFPVTGTFWQATQPVSGTVTTTPPSNASSNIAQINGVTPLMGNGITGTGSQRVTIASDNTAFAVNATLGAETTKVIGTVNVSAGQTIGITANSSVNVAQINGVTPLMGAGNTGTGSPRVTISTDQAALPGMGVGATGSAVPANANYIAGSNGTNLTGYYVDPCQRGAKLYLPISISTATTTRIIAPSTSNKVYFCSFHLFSAGTDNVALVEGTGGTCGTGTAGVAGGTTAATGWNLTAQTGLAWGSGSSAVMATAGTNVDVCLITSAAIQISGHAAYVVAP